MHACNVCASLLVTRARLSSSPLQSARRRAFGIPPSRADMLGIGFACVLSALSLSCFGWLSLSGWGLGGVWVVWGSVWLGSELLERCVSCLRSLGESLAAALLVGLLIDEALGLVDEQVCAFE